MKLKHLLGNLGRLGALAPLLLAASMLFSPCAYAQLSGTKNIPGDYPTLDAAITDLNTVGVLGGSGGVTLNLLAGNPQTAPAGGYAITTISGSAADPIVIQGNGNVITAPNPQVAGVLHDAFFEIRGADYVTLSGFVMREHPANTTTAAASNNMTEWGVALLYDTVSNGAQNVTLQNNTISLNRTYQNTFGIYSNSTHAATTVTTSATATGATGGNSGLRIYGNTINNVNIGIVVVGPTAAADHNEGLDIGGIAPATANTISDYGTTGTFSSYANVSGSVNGVLVRNTRNYNVSYNSIASSAGGVTAGTLRGIFVPAFSNAPSVGALANSITHNSISVRSGNATGGMVGLLVEATTSTPTSTTTITHNNFHTSGHTVAASGTITFLQMLGSATTGPLIGTISDNTFTNLSVNTTGNVTLIDANWTRPAGASTTVNNNSIVTAFAKTGAGGTLRGYNNFGSSPATATETNSNNDFSNISVPTAGATTIDVWRVADGTAPGSRKTITNNTFSNIAATTTSPLRVLIVEYSDSTFAGNNVSGNTIHTVSSSGGSVAGIASSNGNQNFFSNTLHTLTSGGSSFVFGVQITGGATQQVYRNKVYNLENSNALGAVTGITVGGGTTINLHNNLVGDLRLPNSTNTNSLFGINITGGTTINAAFNSVHLAATSVGANFGSTALGAATAPALTLRSNNLVNVSTANGTGLTVAYRRGDATLTTYQAASNANNLWAGTPGPSNLLFHDGTTGDQTLTDYKTRVSPRDGAAISEMPPFLSTSGASPDFLHISAATPTQLESGGVPVPGISDDYDGNARSAATPDIGADEFTGLPIDLLPPVIAYPPLPNTILLGNRIVAANISDPPSGIPGGATAPRVYFRKNADPYVSNACTGSEPAFSCTIDSTMLGGVVIGDSVSYFVIAQDNAGNVGANPGAGLVAANVNTVTTPPTTPNSYTIIAPFPAVVNVGTTETITSLTNPGGLFDLANAGVFASDVIANITTDLAGETGTIALNQRTEEGAGGYWFTIRPSGAARTVTGGGTVLAKINGSDRVLIDGALAGTDRSLTFNSTSVVSGSAALFIGSLGPSQGANNVRIRNVIIQTGTKGSTALTTFAIFVGHSSGAALGPDNDGFRLENSQIRRASVGLQAAGDPSGVLDGLQLLDNDFGDDSVVDSIGRRGLVLLQADGALVRRNQVRNIELADNNPHGMLLGTGVINSVIVANRISNVRYTGTLGYGGKGIDINTGNVASGLTIANNFIAGIGGDGWNALASDSIVGMRIAGATGGINVWHNSINLGSGSFAGNTSGTASAALFVASTTSALNIRNNILANNLDNSAVTTDKAYAIATDAATPGPFSVIDGNDYFVSGPAGLVGLLNAVDRTDLAAWQAASLQDLVSISADPPFVSATDLHVLTTGAIPVDGTAIVIAAVPLDIDGDTRSATTPDIGADEVTTAPSITPPANQAINEDANTGALAFTVSDAQTAAASLVVTVQASSDTALVPLANIVLANLGGGSRSVTVTPVANGNGGPVTITLRVTDGNAEFTDGTFTVIVAPVNDEPGFMAGPNQGLVALTTGLQTVVGWATAISAGPSNESGQVLAFTVTETADPNGIVSGTSVASNGTLQYTLSGVAGTANFDLYLADDGGTASGGDDTSPTATFSITVANGTDLAIVKTSSLATLGSGVMQYTIVVSNLGPNPVTGAVVADTLAAPHTLPAWTCSGSGGVCPASGSGNINAMVDLPVGASVTFQLATTVALPVTTLTNTATVTAPLATPDPITGNNTSTVTDTVAIFRDGFDDFIPPPPWYTAFLATIGH